MAIEQSIKMWLDDIVTPLIGRGKVRPVFGTGKPPFITYTATPISGGVVKQTQVEVKTIDRDFDRAIWIRDTITAVLDMTEQQSSVMKAGLVLRSQLAGGGELFDDVIQMWELSCIYMVDWRVKNEQG